MIELSEQKEEPKLLTCMLCNYNRFCFNGEEFYCGNCRFAVKKKEFSSPLFRFLIYPNQEIEKMGEGK